MQQCLLHEIGEEAITTAPRNPLGAGRGRRKPAHKRGRMTDTPRRPTVPGVEYQLVIQWPFASIVDYAGLIAAEDLLIEGLSDTHDVDGHDAASGTANIFIITRDVSRALAEVKAALEQTAYWPNARIAYRDSTATITRHSGRPA